MYIYIILYYNIYTYIFDIYICVYVYLLQAEDNPFVSLYVTIFYAKFQLI